MVATTTNDLHKNLKAFSERASEAEERLERLESLLLKKEDVKGFDDGNLELKKLATKLESVQAEAAIEKEKARKEDEKHQAEIAKLKYRIAHLLRALTEAEG